MQNQAAGTEKKNKTQRHVQILGQPTKLICHSTVCKGLFYYTAWKANNTMEKHAKMYSF